MCSTEKTEEADFLRLYFKCLAMHPWRAGYIDDYIQLEQYTKNFDFTKKRCFLSVILATTTSQRASDVILDLNSDVIEFNEACNEVMQYFNINPHDFWETLNILQDLKLLKPEQQLTLPELTRFLLNLKENISADRCDLLKPYLSLLVKAGKNTLDIFECAKMRQQLASKENAEVTPLSWECINHVVSEIERDGCDKTHCFHFLKNAEKWIILLGLCKEADGHGYSWSVDKNASYFIAITALGTALYNSVPGAFVEPLLDKLSKINVSKIKSLYSTQDIEDFFNDTDWPRELMNPVEIDNFLDAQIAEKLPYLNIRLPADNQLNDSLLEYFQRENKTLKKGLKEAQTNLNIKFQEKLLAEYSTYESSTKEQVVAEMVKAYGEEAKESFLVKKIGKPYFIDPFIKRFDDFKNTCLLILTSLKTKQYQAEPLLLYLQKLAELCRGYWNDINTFLLRNTVKLFLQVIQKDLDKKLKARFFGKPPYSPHITFIPFLDKVFSCIWEIGNVQWTNAIFSLIKAVFGGLDWFSKLDSFDFTKGEILLEHLKNVQSAIRSLMELKIGEENIYGLFSSLNILKESKLKSLYTLIMWLAKKDIDIVKTFAPIVEAYCSYLDAVAKGENNAEILFKKLDEFDKLLPCFLTQNYKGITGLEIIEGIALAIYGNEEDYPEELQIFLQKPSAAVFVKQNIERVLKNIVARHVAKIKCNNDVLATFKKCLLVHIGEIDTHLSIDEALNQFNVHFEATKSCLNLFIILNQQLGAKSFLNVLKIFMHHYDQGCNFDRLYSLLAALIELPYDLVPSYFNMLAPFLYAIDEKTFKSACNTLKCNIKTQQSKNLETDATKTLICNAFRQSLLGSIDISSSRSTSHSSDLIAGLSAASSDDERCMDPTDKPRDVGIVDPTDKQQDVGVVDAADKPPIDLLKTSQLGQLELSLNEIKSLLDGSYVSAEEKQLIAMDVVQVNKFAADYVKLPTKVLQQKYLTILEDLKKQSDAEVTSLDCQWLAIVSVLMRRTTDIFPNSTQLMVCLFTWRTQGRALLEINTGEGKSYITALLAAREWVRLGTVDVLSANAELIQQDYKQKRICDFFECLNIPSRILSADDGAPYKTGYVNYTITWDRSFKASEITLSATQAVPYPLAACIFDECDWGLLRMVGITFDVVRNLPGDENQKYSWVYDQILDFTDLPAFLSLNDDAVWTSAEDLAQLRLYLHQVANEVQKDSSDRVEESRLNLWLDAACQAKILQEGIHFVVLPDQEHQGFFVAAVPMIKDVPQLGARFSGAVQPFLHALLAKKYRDKNFSPAPELVCVDTQSAMGLASCYKRLIGLSGTLGVTSELKRLMTRLGASSWSIPPHALPQQQEEVPINICHDAISHLQYIYDTINCLKKDKAIDAPPVLIIEEDINKSNELFKKLNLYKEQGWTIQIVTGEEDSAKKTSILTQAEKSNTITVCTPLFSRGLDLHPLHPQGLQVLIACLREENVIKQAKGRTRRYSQTGNVKWIIDASRYGLQSVISLPAQKQIEKIKEIQARLSDNAALERYYTEEAALIREIVLKHFDKLCCILKEHCPKDDIQALHNRLLRLRQTLILKSVETWNNELFKTDPNHQFINPYLRLKEDETFDIYSQQLDCRRGANERVKGVYTEYMTDGERVCNKAENPAICEGRGSSAKSIAPLEKLLTDYPAHLQSVWPSIVIELEKEAKNINLSSDDSWAWHWARDQDLLIAIDEKKNNVASLPIAAPGERSAQPWRWRPNYLDGLSRIRFAADVQKKQEAVAEHVQERFKIFAAEPLFTSANNSTLHDNEPFATRGEDLYNFVMCLQTYNKAENSLEKSMETFARRRELALDCLNLYQIMAPHLPINHTKLAEAVFNLKQIYVTNMQQETQQTIIASLMQQFKWAKQGERAAKYWFNRPLVHDIMNSIWSLLDKAQEENSNEAFLALQNTLEKHSKKLHGRFMLPWTKELPGQIEQAVAVMRQINKNVSLQKTSYQVELLQNPAGYKYVYEAYTGFDKKVMEKTYSAKPLPDQIKRYQPRFAFIKSWKENLLQQKSELSILIDYLNKFICSQDMLYENDSYILPQDLQVIKDNIVALKIDKEQSMTMFAVFQKQAKEKLSICQSRLKELETQTEKVERLHVDEEEKLNSSLILRG